jgi:DNA recombination-dependent growth factor C
MIEESERKRKKKKSRKFMKKEKNQVAKKILPRYFWCQDTSVGFFLQP